MYFTSVFLVSIALCLQSLPVSDARVSPLYREKRRALSESEKTYLKDIYNRFLVTFNLLKITLNPYGLHQDSRQFAVATTNSATIFNPCGLVMNQPLNALSHAYNYFAYTPMYTPGAVNYKRPRGRYIHSEDSIVNAFDTIYRHDSSQVQTVHLVTHLSPCDECTEILQRFVRNYPHIQFIIGYVDLFPTDPPQTQHFALANEPNVAYGQIHVGSQPASSSCKCHTSSVKDEIRRLSSEDCALYPQCSTGCTKKSKSKSKTKCFPSKGLVQVNNISSPMKRMEDLRIGDEVLAVNFQGQLLYSPVIAFLDRVPSSVSEFIEIETEHQQKLQLTPSHLIFINESSKPLLAADIKIGNHLFTLDFHNQSTALSKVTRIDTVSAIGQYAPLTAEGTIIVDGVLASCYADVSADQSEIHALFAPLRFLHYTMPQLTAKYQNEEGIHWYASALIQLNHFMKEYIPNALLPNIIAV